MWPPVTHTFTQHNPGLTRWPLEELGGGGGGVKGGLRGLTQGHHISVDEGGLYFLFSPPRFNPAGHKLASLAPELMLA